MSLYNALFGENEKTDELLDMIGVTRSDFGRFRDVSLNHDGSQIIVTTRCGGGNREDYEYVFEEMRENKNYVEDHDDSFDETYCYFTFNTPEIFKEETKKMSTGENPATVSEKFDKEIKEMQVPGSDAEKRAMEIAEKINKGIEENPNGGVIRL